MFKFGKLFFLFFLFPFLISAQTITSKSAGGYWGEAATWIGGIVPNQNNDVVIDGLVIVQNGNCRNLTINPAGTLQAYSPNYCCYEYSLTVAGNVLNNGTIKNNPDGNWLALKVAGNITNNAMWLHSRTDLTGSADQYMTLGANKIFESAFTVTDTLGKIIANTALEFSQAIKLNGCVLDMKNYPLTLNGTSATIYNGRVINTADLTGKRYPVLYDITYEGNPNIKGFFIMRDANFKGVLTITDTLQAWSPGYCCYEFTMRVTGNVINNGIIRNNPDGNWLALKVSGNITNNATWIHTRTDLVGNADQYLILAQNKSFESAFSVTDSLGSIIAGSALEFSQGFNLNNCILDMKNNPLTLNGSSATMYNGSVINTGNLTGRKSPTLYNITYEGNPNIKGLFLVRDAKIKGVLTVTDTLQGWSPGYCCYEFPLNITGNIINNGLLRNNPDGNMLVINVSGNITNNALWKHKRTDLDGSLDQLVVLAPNKIFESSFNVTDSIGAIVAGSALEFSLDVNLNSCVLDMKNKSLTLNGSSAAIYNGRVINTADLTGRKYPTLNNITYEGFPNIKGLFQIRDAAMKGTVTITDTLQAWSPGYCCYEFPLTVTGNLINNGTVMNNADGNRIALNISGNISNNNIWNAGATRFTGTGRRTIVARNIQGSIEATGSNVILTGENILPSLKVTDGAYCELAGDGYLIFLQSLPTGNFSNKGIVEVKKEIKAAGNYTFFALTGNVASLTGADTLTTYSYGNQIPFSFSNGVKRWWKVRQASKTFKTLFSSITFNYSDSELGNNNEESLQVFYSADSARSWKQISSSSNITRDVQNNTIVITTTSGEGDYLLSSCPDPTSASPSIITTVIGSSNIRIGAPTRYKIHYVNNSDLTADDFLITINTGSKVHIKSVELPLESGGYLSLPKDSLFYNNEDTTLVMYALQMAPREERTFDVIVIGDKPNLNKAKFSKSILFDPVTITAAAALTWVAWKAGTFIICKGIDYIGDKASEGIKMSPEEQKRYDQMVKGGVPNELKAKPGAIKTFALKTVGVEVLKRTLELAPGGTAAVNITGTVTQNVAKVAPNLRQRIFNWFYKETGLYGVETTDNGNSYQPQVSTVNQKKGALVTSCDPNEKSGPGGYGDQRFITSAGKMTYQILFENKKEAAAPAYKISIVDTLRPEFDPETVEFGKTSHEGEKYKWKITRSGNILKWEIEGIELPPNITPPEGEGWVSFSVFPKKAIASGSDLVNKATIVFDLNNPITTNDYSNRLDFIPPSTTMNQLAQSIKNKTFTVKWKSSDGTGGSGVESATVFMSVDNGPFNLAGVSNSDSLTITALPGTHTYSFYALASDVVGNVELTHPAAITTQVINSVDSPENGIPIDYALQQNFPNPFNPTTRIKYSIPTECRVNVSVFNMLGQCVSELMNDTRSAGNFEIQFDGGNFASGVYLYRVIAIGPDGKLKYSNTRKMVLIK